MAIGHDHVLINYYTFNYVTHNISRVDIFECCFPIIKEIIKILKTLKILLSSKRKIFTSSLLNIFITFYHHRKSDVMIGGLYENQVSRKFLSSSIPYYQDDITWVSLCRPHE